MIGLKNTKFVLNVEENIGINLHVRRLKWQKEKQFILVKMN